MAGTIVVDKVAESPNNVKTVTTSLSNQIAISSNADQRSGLPNKVSTSQKNGLPGSSTSSTTVFIFDGFIKVFASNCFLSVEPTYSFLATSKFVGDSVCTVIATPIPLITALLCNIGIPILLKTELAGLFEENFPLLR
jgi:hypothetical protein